MKPDVQRYLLLEDVVGRKLATMSLKPGVDVDVQRGNIVQDIPSTRFNPILAKMKPKSSDEVLLESVEFKGLFVVCRKRDIIPINQLCQDLLLAVADFEERLILYNDPARLAEIDCIKLNSNVFVMLGDGCAARGCVRYIGPLKPKKQGIYFGVQLEEKGLGDGDGSYGDKRYFQAPPRSSVFVAISRIESADHELAGGSVVGGRSGGLPLVIDNHRLGILDRSSQEGSRDHHSNHLLMDGRSVGVDEVDRMDSRDNGPHGRLRSNQNNVALDFTSPNNVRSTKSTPFSPTPDADVHRPVIPESNKNSRGSVVRHVPILVESRGGEGEGPKRRMDSAPLYVDPVVNMHTDAYSDRSGISPEGSSVSSSSTVSNLSRGDMGYSMSGVATFRDGSNHDVPELPRLDSSKTSSSSNTFSRHGKDSEPAGPSFGNKLSDKLFKGVNKSSKKHNGGQSNGNYCSNDQLVSEPHERQRNLVLPFVSGGENFDRGGAQSGLGRFYSTDRRVDDREFYGHTSDPIDDRAYLLNGSLDGVISSIDDRYSNSLTHSADSGYPSLAMASSGSLVPDGDNYVSGGRNNAGYPQHGRSVSLVHQRAEPSSDEGLLTLHDPNSIVSAYSSLRPATSYDAALYQDLSMGGGASGIMRHSVSTHNSSSNSLGGAPVDVARQSAGGGSRRAKQGVDSGMVGNSSLASVVAFPIDAVDSDLKLGERVVWPSDRDNEFGVVRWVGYLKGHKDLIVGVEFENPVGEGTGKYLSCQVFKTKPGHASFVPILGLIRAHDFDEMLSSVGPNAAAMDRNEVRKMSLNLLGDANHRRDSAAGLSGASTRSSASIDPGGSSSKSSQKNSYGHPMPTPDRSSRLKRGRAAESPVTVEKNHRGKMENDIDDDYGFSGSHRLNSILPIGGNHKNLPRVDEGDPVTVGHSRFYDGSSGGEAASGRPPKLATLGRTYSLGDCVRTTVGGHSVYGVVRWVGRLGSNGGGGSRLGLQSIPDVEESTAETGVAPALTPEPESAGDIIAGIELEEEIPVKVKGSTDGFYKGVKYFGCEGNRGMFVPLQDLVCDDRFEAVDNDERDRQCEFGDTDFGAVTSYEAPVDARRLPALLGKQFGIQGHRNSCYLDATLFAMFAFSDVFDGLLTMEVNLAQPAANKKARQLQSILSTEIVYVLRRYWYVRADHVHRLRVLLSQLLPEIQGLTELEKDPEELLNGLFTKILKTPPYLKFSSGEESHLCQLIVDESGASLTPTVQYLFDKSFCIHSQVKLKEIPKCLIVQLPRYGKQKIYNYVVPSMTLDISHVLEHGARDCCGCGRPAMLECSECFLTSHCSLAEVTFCDRCFRLAHSSPVLSDHSPTPVPPPSASLASGSARHLRSAERSSPDSNSLPLSAGAGRTTAGRVLLTLSAVLCIETSHYVTFAKSGLDPHAPWCLFDSMADRKGGEDGYNIPEVRACPGLESWLLPDGVNRLQNQKMDLSLLPAHLRRLLQDCYIAFYVLPPDDGSVDFSLAL